jgi:hypothetical protein
MAADVFITRPERDVDYLALTVEARDGGSARPVPPGFDCG